jgi:succinate dehydrogenase / fumarate reductase cytochrome b subunit
MRRYAYYPGCSAKASTRELDVAVRALARRLDIELVELVEAGCCGSCEIKALDADLHFMLNARILALAADRGLEILTVCDTCQANLLHTSRHLANPAEHQRLAAKLAQAGIRLEEIPRTRHIVSVLMEDIGANALAEMVVRPLEGLQVAPFACCHAFRGAGATPGSRNLLTELVELTGATAASVRVDSDCCGFHVLLTNEALSARTSGKFLARCVQAGADCVVTTSPLCHTAMDIYRSRIDEVTGMRIELPVLHVEQLLGLSLGLPTRELGLQRHIVPTAALLQRIPGRIAARESAPLRG